LEVFLDSGSPPQDRKEKLRQLNYGAYELLGEPFWQIWFAGMDERLKAYRLVDRDQAFFGILSSETARFESATRLHDEIMKHVNHIFESLMSKVENDPPSRTASRRGG